MYIGRKYNSLDKTSPSIESNIIPQLDIKYESIHCGKFDRRYFPNTIQGIPMIFTAIISSLRILYHFKPNIVVSFGGYVSFPVVFSAWLLRIPSITHEQTPTISLTTKLNSFFVKKIALSFPSNYKKKKSIIIGNLLRHEIFQIKNNQIKNFIYVTAGNQGSQIINNTLKRLLPLLKKYKIIHQTGKNDYQSFKQLENKYSNYSAFEYITADNIGWILNNASLIISRAGANTTQEIAALKQKSILIPLPFSQQNEQLQNAKYLQTLLPKSTIIIEQNQLDESLLYKSIEALIKTKKQKFHITSNTNYKMLSLIHEIV